MKSLKRAVNREIVKAMKEADVSRAELARRLKSSRPAVTYMLRPTRNLTLDTLEETARVIGYKVKVVLEK